MTDIGESEIDGHKFGQYGRMQAAKLMPCRAGGCQFQTNTPPGSRASRVQSPSVTVRES